MIYDLVEPSACSTKFCEVPLTAPNVSDRSPLSAVSVSGSPHSSPQLWRVRVMGRNWGICNQVRDEWPTASCPKIPIHDSRVGSGNSFVVNIVRFIRMYSATSTEKEINVTNMKISKFLIVHEGCPQGGFDGRGQPTPSPMLTAIMSGGVGISGRELYKYR